MVESTYKEAFVDAWVKEHIKNSLHELVIYRKVIPWQRIIDRLVPFYCEGRGRLAKSLRVMVALAVIGKLRTLSDEQVVSHVKENRYLQYFCNVSDQGLHTFLDPSSLTTFRDRLGARGAAMIEEEVFGTLRRAGVIRADAQLTDSTVLEDHIVYPTDVLLLYKAFKKMGQFAQRNKIPVWWDEAHLKQRWRAYSLAKKKEKVTFLWEFYLLLVMALGIFGIHVESCTLSDKERQKGRLLLNLLGLLDEQTQQKLAGEKHIKDRIVSLDEVDARPLQKGKSYPATEFGTTLQVSFNRDGFMVTVENFIGQPGDQTLYPFTQELYRKRMRKYPELAVTDLGFRSLTNFKAGQGKVKHLFMGQSRDVPEAQQDYCRRVRSATEGFLAVAKHWRGFGRSLYRRFEGDRIWTHLCQIAYNLKKFLQRYREEKLSDKSLIKLGLLPA